MVIRAVIRSVSRFRNKREIKMKKSKQSTVSDRSPSAILVTCGRTRKKEMWCRSETDDPALYRSPVFQHIMIFDLLLLSYAFRVFTETHYNSSANLILWRSFVSDPTDRQTTAKHMYCLYVLSTALEPYCFRMLLVVMDFGRYTYNKCIRKSPPFAFPTLDRINLLKKIPKRSYPERFDR